MSDWNLNMNRTAGICAASSERDSEGTLCRLCMKNNDYYYNIYTSNVACRVTVKDALKSLLGLEVAVGDGLPTTLCPLCLKKLTEFSVFKITCLESDAKLRKCSGINCFWALEGGAEADVSEGDLLEEYDEEESFRLVLESDSDEGDECRNSDAGTKVAQASTSQGEEVDAEGTGAIGIDLDTLPVLAKTEAPNETDATEPTSMENGEMIQKESIDMDSMTEALDLPAPETASDFFALLEPKIRESHSRKAWKVMDKDIEICGSLLADKITLCSISDDGQFHSKSRRASKIRGDRATKTVAGEISGCDNHDITKDFRVTDSGKSGPKAVVQENKDISTRMIKNPGKRARSKDKSYHCFDCGVVFNAKHDLIEHPKIHCGSGSLDIDANSSIGKHLALKILVSRGETDSSNQPTSSKSLNKPLCERQGMIRKGNGFIKENFGGITAKKNVRGVRRSSIVDGKSCTHSPHTTKKPSCGECEWSFPKKSYLVRHIQNRAKETPYSCGECEKSFSRKSYLVRHIQTHTKEKPYSCGECEKSFSLKSNLVVHIRTHTKEKPYSCGECEKSFSQKSDLVRHIRTHTKEKPYSCGECEKSFSLKSNLVVHFRTHTKKKPYSCNECEKSYTTKQNLVLHMRVHRKEALFMH